MALAQRLEIRQGQALMTRKNATDMASNSASTIRLFCSVRYSTLGTIRKVTPGWQVKSS